MKPTQSLTSQQLQSQINAGGGWHAAELQRALGARLWSLYKAEKASILPLPKQGGLVSELRSYTRLLAAADQLYRAECKRGPLSYSPMAQFKRAQRRPETSSRLYERASEALQSLAEGVPGVAAYFDRPLAEEGFESPEDAPRLHNSRSSFRRVTSTERNLASTFLRQAIEPV